MAHGDNFQVHLGYNQVPSPKHRAHLCLALWQGRMGKGALKTIIQGKMSLFEKSLHAPYSSWLLYYCHWSPSMLLLCLFCSYIQGAGRPQLAICGTLCSLGSITNLVMISTVKHPSVVRGSGDKTDNGNKDRSAELRQQNRKSKRDKGQGRQERKIEGEVCKNKHKETNSILHQNKGLVASPKAPSSFVTFSMTIGLTTPADQC